MKKILLFAVAAMLTATTITATNATAPTSTNYNQSCSSQKPKQVAAYQYNKYTGEFRQVAWGYVRVEGRAYVIAINEVDYPVRKSDMCDYNWMAKTDQYYGNVYFNM